MSSYVLVDAGMRYASLEINSLMEQRKERDEYEAWLKAIRNKKSTVIETQINPVKSKWPRPVQT